MTDQAALENRVTVLKAIASAPRLMMLEALVAGDLSVGELTAVAGSDISTVSRHLSVLRNAGIVSSARYGSQVLYHLQTPCVLQFCSCVEKVLSERECGSGKRPVHAGPVERQTE
jgi:DNA-binding transcriptional ArsR family regulator